MENPLEAMNVAGMNYPAIIVCAVAYMILGALWYSPVLFGKAWMNKIGKTKEQLAAGFSPINYVFALILSFIASYGIARIMYWAGASEIADGVKIGLLTGVCFVLATMGVNDLFENRKCSLTIMNVLYHIVGFIMIGIILSVWR